MNSICVDSRNLPSILCFIVLTVMSFACCTQANQFAGGTGKLHDPYQIATAYQLISIGSDPNLLDKHFVLVNDIDLNPGLPGGVFTQAVIAPDTNLLEGGFQGMSFNGRFDGNGFSIRNLTISGEGNLGLFGRLDQEARIFDLTMVQTNIVGTGTSIGIISGENYGCVDNCHSIGIVSGMADCVGGVVGYNVGCVSDCSNSGSVSGKNNVGGLAGDNGGSISNCQSSGIISGHNSVGGIVGLNNSRINHCTSNATVSGNDEIGGLTGYSIYGSITNCTCTGTVSGETNVGGLVGRNSFISLMDQCYSTGAVSGYVGIGGLAGISDLDSHVANCYSTGSVSGTSDVGGLMGLGGGTITHCYSIGPVSGIGTVGGLIGNSLRYSPVVISNCFWDIETSGLTESAGGTGLNTDLMQNIETFLEADWDFAGHIQNGGHEIWQMPDDGGYPILSVFDGAQPSILPGHGTTDDPYLISTVLELAAIRHDPDAAYKLTTNLDLSGIQWSRPVVSQFSGRFNGSGFCINQLTISGSDHLGLFGELESRAEIHDLGVVDVNIMNTGLLGQTGGLAGLNRGRVFNCCSVGAVSGVNGVGGLVGKNDGGSVRNCYSAGMVRGSYAGGIIGDNKGSVSHCYSTSAINGTHHLGGLIGRGSQNVTNSFWDTETSGQTQSEGGIGLATEQMQDHATYLGAGWDFTYHPGDSPDVLWWMTEQSYPRLWWQYGYAYAPSPVDKATQVSHETTLQWSPGGPDLRHDVYFGDDEDSVANATRKSQGIYCGPQSVGMVAYDPNGLGWGKTYYWRIDGINEPDPNSSWKGEVWSFNTEDSVLVFIVDDFELYDDLCNRIFFTWQDGWGHSGGMNIAACNVAPYSGNGSGGIIGNENPPFAEQAIVHSGGQSMPMDYDNETWPWFSEAHRSWSTPQNLTIQDADTLTLYFRGEVENSQDSLYVVVEDSHGGNAVLAHQDVHAVLATDWCEWRIPLNDLDITGVDVQLITKMVIGVGDRNSLLPGGRGRIYIDNIQLTKHMR